MQIYKIFWAFCEVQVDLPKQYLSIDNNISALLVELGSVKFFLGSKNAGQQDMNSPDLNDQLNYNQRYRQKVRV